MINFTVSGESSNRCRTQAAQIHLHVVSPPAQITTSQPNRISFATASICRLAAGGKTPDIVAPFELKGAHTRDLDAIMPGRTKRTVQQAGTKPVDFVLLMAKIQGCVARLERAAGRWGGYFEGVIPALAARVCGQSLRDSPDLPPVSTTRSDHRTMLTGTNAASGTR